MSTQRSLIADARYEVIPMKNLESQIEFIPTGASVSVTCSPAKGQQATLDLAARIVDLGHVTVPHLSARLAEDAAAVKRLGAFCRDHGLTEVFLVAGDAPEPVGPYDGVVSFLRDFLDTDHGLSRIGVTAYPDGHALIEQSVVHEALHAKQALLEEAGIPGFASTQMCFDLTTWKEWAVAERAVQDRRRHRRGARLGGAPRPARLRHRRHAAGAGAARAGRGAARGHRVGPRRRSRSGRVLRQPGVARLRRGAREPARPPTA